MAEMADDRVLIHRIDAGDRVVFVNDQWLAFAKESGASGLTAGTVLNRPIWDFIGGWQVRHLYVVLINRLRKSPGIHAKIPLRCDTPEIRRFMELDAFSPGEGVVEFRSRIVRVEKRDLTVPFVRASGPAREQLLMCSLCNRVQTAKPEWLEVEEAIERYVLFSSEGALQLSFGVCRSCHRSFLDILKPFRKIFRGLIRK